MIKNVLRFAVALAALAPISSALAADLDPPPPPVEELRPATYDWSGFHVGAFLGGTFIEGHYVVTELCDDPLTVPVEACGYDPELSGVGIHGGFLAGYNYQMDDFVLGIEGDYAFGGEVASNEEPNEMSYMDFDAIATLRLRAGVAFDDTLIYATGGVAFIDSTFYSTDAPIGSGLTITDSQWLTGYAVGGGIEHAFSDAISGRLEYMYIGVPDAQYNLDNGVVAGTVDQEFESIHTIRATMAYNFSL